MFIELTDLLRCPSDHTESFLVLLPDEMEGRHVRRGRLGCPVCHREFPIEAGVARFGEPRFPPSADEDADSMVNADTLAAFLGLEGPGGYAGLVGSAAGQVAPLSRRLPGIHLIAVNPPPAADLAGVSVLEAGMLPLRSRSLRGVTLGRGYGADPHWQAEAARVVLPGLRVVGQGRGPEQTELEVLAATGGWWVSRRL